MLTKYTSCLSLFDNILLNNMECELVKKLTFNFIILHRSDDPSSWAKFSIHFTQAIADCVRGVSVNKFLFYFLPKIQSVNDGGSP